MKRNWPLGSIIRLEALTAGRWSEYAAMGLTTCQVRLPWDVQPTAETAEALTRANRTLPKVSAILSWGEPARWNFSEGPSTLGIVPLAYRGQRVRALKAQLDFVGDCGVKLVNTHAGFIPEWPGDPQYAEVVHTLADLASHARSRGITFCLETGQETPVTLKRAILDSGANNLGINLDPANLLMYGKANPVDAVGVFGEFVRSVHIKDGRYPRGDMRLLGDEMPVGDGMVDFAVLLSALEEKGFDGPLIIEREISGEKQMEDIRRAMDHIHPLLD